MGSAELELKRQLQSYLDAGATDVVLNCAGPCGCRGGRRTLGSRRYGFSLATPPKQSAHHRDGMPRDDVRRCRGSLSTDPARAAGDPGRTSPRDPRRRGATGTSFRGGGRRAVRGEPYPGPRTLKTLIGEGLVSTAATRLRGGPADLPELARCTSCGDPRDGVAWPRDSNATDADRAAVAD